MNEVFLIGTIITEVEFKFIINNKKNKSIAIFKIEVLDNQILNVCAINELADYVFANYNINDRVFINGNLSSKYVSINYIDYLG